MILGGTPSRAGICARGPGRDAIFPTVGLADELLVPTKGQSAVDELG